MSSNRIQKLLFSEYSDFDDLVLVESPFAETTRDGRGVRQVQIGLTPTKLILATDVIEDAIKIPVQFYPGRVDADIEGLELVSVIPIDLVTLSVFRTRKKQVLKAKFHDGNPNHRMDVVYFELGGTDKRKMFWNLWCERVMFLSPNDKGGSSLTETSVGSSTSASSLYVAKTKVFRDQIWQYYTRTNSSPAVRPDPGPAKWTDKELFFGNKMEIVGNTVEPVSYSKMADDSLEMRTLYQRQRSEVSRSSVSCGPHLEQIKSGHINRFGEGVEEKCRTGLYLPPISSPPPAQSTDNITQLPKHNLSKLCDEAFEIWQSGRILKSNRHPRKYGFTPMPSLDYGFGMYNFTRNEAFTIQLKRTPSAMAIRRQEPELLSLATRMRLCRTISHESLRPWAVARFRSHHTNSNTTKIKFWTSKISFCASSNTTCYKNTQHYLRMLSEHLKQNQSRTDRRRKYLIFGKKIAKKRGAEFEDWDSVSEVAPHCGGSSKLSAWDVDSSALALQLTRIESQLFLDISVKEIGLVLKLKRSVSTTPLMTWVMFGHRVTYLVATEILKTVDLKVNKCTPLINNVVCVDVRQVGNKSNDGPGTNIKKDSIDSKPPLSRGRLISRFVNCADKCHLLHNFQSCRNILAGLQCPAVYRLRQTWTYLREHHATRYRRFQVLSRLYKDTRLHRYQNSFYKASLVPPFIPSFSHLIAVALGVLFDKPSTFSSYSDCTQPGGFKDEADEHIPKAGNIFKHIFSALKMYHSNRLNTHSSPSESAHKLMHGAIDLDNFESHFTSLTTADFQQSLKAGENFLILGQSAARKYDLGENITATNFLLNVPYLDAEELYSKSLQVESQTCIKQ